VVRQGRQKVRVHFSLVPNLENTWIRGYQIRNFPFVHRPSLRFATSPSDALSRNCGGTEPGIIVMHDGRLEIILAAAEVKVSGRNKVALLAREYETVLLMYYFNINLIRWMRR
jgi:hypothetical protein